jgi:hypothetical protein
MSTTTTHLVLAIRSTRRWRLFCNRCGWSTSVATAAAAKAAAAEHEAGR